MRSSDDEQPELDRLGDGLCRGNAIELVMYGFDVIPRGVRGNAQDRGNLRGVFAERDPAQTLDLSRRQARPVLAEKQIGRASCRERVCLGV